MFRVGAAVAFLGVVLAGCGGDDPDEPAGADTVTSAAASGVPSATTSARPVSGGQQALETAVRAYSAAYLGGDSGAAFSLLSKRCQLRLGQQQMVDLTDGAKAQYGPQDILSLKVDALQGTLARVTYTYAASALDQSSEPWVFEDGGWREDDCG
jgi:hypothetical protein